MTVIDIAGKRVIVIVGLPATGKSTLADILHSEDHGLYSADEYLHRKEEFSSMVHNDYSNGDNMIIEGTLVYDLLLSPKFQPDLIIHCMAKKADRQLRFEQRGKSFEGVASLDKQLLHKWYQYLQLGRLTPIVEHLT